jgi:hypothetical protein
LAKPISDAKALENSELWHHFSSGQNNDNYHDAHFSFKDKMEHHSMFLFVIVGWVFGGFACAETGWLGTDVYLHNTLNIIAHIQLVILCYKNLLT